MDYFTADWHIGEAQTPNTHSFFAASANGSDGGRVAFAL